MAQGLLRLLVLSFRSGSRSARRFGKAQAAPAPLEVRDRDGLRDSLESLRRLDRLGTWP